MSLSLSSLLSRKAAPAQQAAPSLDSDAAVRQAWSLTLADWSGLTDQQRSFYRWNLTKAPGFQA